MPPTDLSDEKNLWLDFFADLEYDGSQPPLVVIWLFGLVIFKRGVGVEGGYPLLTTTHMRS